MGILKDAQGENEVDLDNSPDWDENDPKYHDDAVDISDSYMNPYTMDQLRGTSEPFRISP